MSWHELYTRGCQELQKRSDALRYRLGVPVVGEPAASAADRPGRFFFDVGELGRIVGLLRERFPAEAVRIVSAAERICRHRFDLLGHEDLNLGSEIDWHLDVVHARRAPRKPWHQIRFLDFDQVGDAKLIWELNRHQHLVLLAQAWCLTQDPSFVHELLRQWYDWHRENPYPIGINWASSLEAAFRSLSWLWVQHLLAGCPAVPERFLPDLRHSLAVHGRHIERYLSTYFSPNTHLLGEAAALFFIGTLWPCLPQSRCWQQLGSSILLHEGARQVRPDGMHFEQSTHYHVYALDFLLHFRILAEVNRFPLDPGLDGVMMKMLEVLAVLGQSGALPRLGDDDGGRVFDARRNRAEHLFDPLTTGAVLFERADWRAVAGALRPETLWLLGPERAMRYDRLPSVPARCASAAFESSGLYVLASAEPMPQQLLVDAGLHGAGTGGHGHADALAIQVAIGGREVLTDPGTFVYVDAGGERDRFRGTAAHNTLTVDSASQAEPMGPFAWHELPEVRAERWVSLGPFDLLVASHSGYQRLSEPVLHRRWVFHLRSHFWLVRDQVLGRGTHRLDLAWHLAPGLAWKRFANGWAASVEGRAWLALLPGPCPEGWSPEIAWEGVSPAYGKQEPAAVLRFRTQAQLPAEFAALLLPRPESLEEIGGLERLEGSTAEVSGWRYSDRQCSHSVFYASPGSTWRVGDWSSDAAFLYCGVAAESGKPSGLLCEGSYVDFQDRRLVALPGPVDSCQWSAGPAAEVRRSSEVFFQCVESSDSSTRPWTGTPPEAPLNG